MGSPSIHGEFLLSPGAIPSLLYQMTPNEIARGSFRHRSVVVDWLIIPIQNDQGNTNSEATHGITVEWDFTSVNNPARKPNYIAIIAGYEMPSNMTLTANLNGQVMSIECTRGSDPFFYIALANQTTPDPEQHAGDWPTITITLDVSPSTFENIAVKNDATWELYYLPSTDDLVAGPQLNLFKVAQRSGSIYRFITPADGNASGRYIFGKPTLIPSGAVSLVNVNSASVEVLDNLPNIGPVLAQKIIDSRPYASVEELERVDGIGPSLFNQIRPLVTV